MNNIIVLAAGKGTRMYSELPKVCHKVLEKPMINYILDTFHDFNKYVVVGYKKEVVMQHVLHDVTYVIQEEQLGTGHAVRCVSNLKGHDGITVVINGDLPFVSRNTIEEAIGVFKKNSAKLVLLTSNVSEPGKSGRVILNDDNTIKKIVEFKDANDSEREVRNVNVGLYIFDNKILFEYIEKINNQNNQNEYYLTDVVELLINDNNKVFNFSVSELESLSANDKYELAKMESKYKNEIIKKHLLNGISVSLDNVTIGPDVKLGKDVIIRDFSYITGSVEIEDGSIIGPFARIREKTIIGKRSVIGNYVEIKNSTIGANTKIAHHAYIGDAIIGDNVNIGCGVITANYDGKKKHMTHIADGSFVGSNVTLIAPIELGENSFIAAGSVVSKNIHENEFAIERADLRVRKKR